MKNLLKFVGDFIIVIDYNVDKAFQLPLSKEWKEKFLGEDPDEAFEEYRKENGFSDNCFWIISSEPINLCIENDNDEADVIIRKPNLKANTAIVQAKKIGFN